MVAVMVSRQAALFSWKCRPWFLLLVLSAVCCLAWVDKGPNTEHTSEANIRGIHGTTQGTGGGEESVFTFATRARTHTHTQNCLHTKKKRLHPYTLLIIQGGGCRGDTRNHGTVQERDKERRRGGGVREGAGRGKPIGSTEAPPSRRLSEDVAALSPQHTDLHPECLHFCCLQLHQLSNKTTMPVMRHGNTHITHPQTQISQPQHSTSSNEGAASHSSAIPCTIACQDTNNENEPCTCIRRCLSSASCLAAGSESAT